MVFYRKGIFDVRYWRYPAEARFYRGIDDACRGIEARRRESRIVLRYESITSTIFAADGAASQALRCLRLTR